MKSTQSADGTARGSDAAFAKRVRAVASLAVGDAVVYASHGIGCVEARGPGRGDSGETVVLLFESGLRVTLPVARAHGALRSPAGEAELEDVRHTLRAEPAARIEPWSKRIRSIRDKVAAGEVTGLAEVVRDGLQRHRQHAASPGERGLFLQARTLLAAEIAFARGTDAANADVWIVEQIDEHAER